jgi:hypothetical protein
MLGEDLLELGDETQRLGMLALPHVAAKDQAGGAGFHGLACLLQHGLIPGALSPRDKQQGTVRRPDHGIDGLLSRELRKVGLRDIKALLPVGTLCLAPRGPLSPGRPRD